MKQIISVNLDVDERMWLKQKSQESGIGISALIRRIVVDAHKADPHFIGNVNRSLENARIEDLENES